MRYSTSRSNLMKKKTGNKNKKGRPRKIRRLRSQVLERSMRAVNDPPQKD